MVLMSGKPKSDKPDQVAGDEGNDPGAGAEERVNRTTQEGSKRKNIMSDEEEGDQQGQGGERKRRASSDSSGSVGELEGDGRTTNEEGTGEAMRGTKETFTYPSPLGSRIRREQGRGFRRVRVHVQEERTHDNELQEESLRRSFA